MAPPVKVYGPVNAGCPQRVMACLMELDLDFQVIHIDLQSGDHKKPEFLLRQPFGLVPVIEDGDFTMFESRAIVRYLATKHADRAPKLLGTTVEERATVDQWLEVESHCFNDLVYTLVLELIVLPASASASTSTSTSTATAAAIAGKEDAAAKEEEEEAAAKKEEEEEEAGHINLVTVDSCKKKLAKVLDVYESRLSRSKYLAGEDYSLADLSHLPGLRFLLSTEESLGLADLIKDRNNVRSWCEDILARPAWKKVVDLSF